jgi:hypothetical protein
MEAMTILSFADAAERATSRHLTSGTAGDVPVDVLVEGPGAERLARHILARLVRVLPVSPVLHDEALLAAGRALDDLLPGLASDNVPFVAVSVGRRLERSSSGDGEIVLADPTDACALVPSVVVVARELHVVGVATAIAAPAGPMSLVAATVSSSRAALSTVLARHVLALGPTSAEPLLRMSDASGLAITASGALFPC